MIRNLGIFVATIFAVLSLIHFYWAVGGTTSGFAIPSDNGKPLFSPSPLTTFLVALALFFAMFAVLGRLGFWGNVLPGWVFYWGIWVISLLFFLRAIGEFRYVGFFKRIVNTEFARWDTYLFSPLCLFIAIVTFLINLKLV
jgi:Protein of unknown function (DUF3995)